MAASDRKSRRWLLESESELPLGERLLLHVCCAPCSAGSLERLTSMFRVSMYFFNPNIHPRAEFFKRLEAARTVSGALDIPLLVEDYDPAPWDERVRGLETCTEGGKRCTECIHLRLDRTARYAVENGFALFGTTLTISPRKDHRLINRLGREAGSSYGIPFLACDLKKNHGFLHSVEQSRRLELYRQEYCGCRYSARERADSPDTTVEKN